MAEALTPLSSFKKHFNDQLTCSVCLDQYTNPKTLPCNHSFCLGCIQPLPVEIKDGKHYISCPTCRVDHPVPQGGAANLPNAFHISSFLELQGKLTIRSSSTTCPKHNDPLKVYCETCCQVICRDCTISREHKTHDFYLITECYPKHHQQLQNGLDLVKHKLGDINTVVIDLATREREVLQQGQQLKEQINTHAQQIIEQVQKSQTLLSQQVDTIVQQKTQVLTAHRQQAQKLHNRLKTCQEMIEHNLKEWTKQQILTEKHTMIDEINTATQHVDPTALVLQTKEKADIRFVKTDIMEKEIGLITTPASIKQPSTATLTPHAPPLSTALSSQRKSNLTTSKRDQLPVPVGGASCSFTLPVPTALTTGKPVNIITKKLHGPWGIAVYENGNTVVIEHERNGHCVTLLNKEGVKVKSFGTEGTKEGQFTRPRGVAIAKDGHILVTDNHRLQKLTTDGACVKSVGSRESGHSQLQFDVPQSITVHPTTGQIFVADMWNNRIQVYNNDLAFLYTIALHDRKKLKCRPYDVELDNEGYLYVAEFGNHCITKLTTTGQFIARFGSEGSAPGHLSCPSSLTICNNLVYVSERGNHRVSIFDTTGNFFHCFGKKGNGKREFNEPSGLAVATVNHKLALYVSDTRNDRIVVYQLNDKKVV